MRFFCRQNAVEGCSTVSLRIEGRFFSSHCRSYGGPSRNCHYSRTVAILILATMTFKELLRASTLVGRQSTETVLWATVAPTSSGASGSALKKERFLLPKKPAFLTMPARHR